MSTTTTYAALADLVRDHYVLADRADVMAGRIRDLEPRLEALLPDVAAANRLLHEHVPDRHLGLRRPGLGKDPERRGAVRAGGVARVELRDDGVGVLALRPVFAGPEVAGPFLEAAARLLADADALVLDLRECGGGDSDTAAMVHGWLLGPEPVVLGRFEKRDADPVAYVSRPLGTWHHDGPVVALTSAGTFSGGEDLAYVLQSLGRARVVGEVTGGGAHPVDHWELPGGWTAQIPTGRIVVAATGANWEGVGVRPDVECPRDEALSVALAVLTSDVERPRS